MLPFVNGTHDASLDYLSDGISDTLINNLSLKPRNRVGNCVFEHLQRNRAIAVAIEGLVNNAEESRAQTSF